MMLADLGAEVIKIEQPGRGDETRHWGPPFKGKTATYYMSLNRSKKSIAIDLKHEQGRQIVKDLISKSDIFIQNFLPKAIQKLNLDYPQVKSLNSKLIYATVSGYPHGSKQENDAAFDLTI